MKDLIFALVIAMVLAFGFSVPSDALPSWGFGTQYEGDSGPVLPGGSELTAQPGTPPETGESRTTEATEETVPRIVEVITEEEEHMDGTLIAFWLGIVAVLIGEASALLVAFAWRKWCGWVSA